MIDLETLDTRPTAVILSVGAVRFDAHSQEFAKTFHKYIDIDSSLSAGRTVSGSTLLWWLDQSDDARRRIITAQAEPFRKVLSDLSDFIGPDDRVWGNGVGFDNVILADAYRSVELNMPWRFWGDMCYRTMKNTFRHVPKPQFDGVRHDALDDAVFQAMHLQRIFESLRS